MHTKVTLACSHQISKGERKQNLPTVGEPSIFTEACNGDIRKMRCFLCSQKSPSHTGWKAAGGNEEESRHNRDQWWLHGYELWGKEQGMSQRLEKSRELSKKAKLQPGFKEADSWNKWTVYFFLHVCGKARCINLKIIVPDKLWTPCLWGLQRSSVMQNIFTSQSSPWLLLWMELCSSQIPVLKP